MVTDYGERCCCLLDDDKILKRNCDDLLKINYVERVYSDMYECTNFRSNSAGMINVTDHRTSVVAAHFTWTRIVRDGVVFTVSARRKTTSRTNNLQYAKSDAGWGGAQHGSHGVGKRTGDGTRNNKPWWQASQRTKIANTERRVTAISSDERTDSHETTKKKWRS